MKNFIYWILLCAFLAEIGSAVPTTTPTPDEDDDDADWDEEDDSTELDDERVYKNPRNSPSTECPRDEEQATLVSQKCLRKCSSDEDCKSKKKKCLCDGACGMSCIKPDRECPDLQQPSLGAVTLTGKFFASRATYTCPHGYHVVGLQSRLCQADGKWAGTEPACKQNIYCLTPPTIEHARHSALPEQTTFDLDSTVQYHCHTGYVTNGFPRAKCLAIDGKASWYGPDISCEPRSCGQPTDPSHGWHAGECYSFGCRITYHCGDGYELVGKQERFCQADGSWSPKELPNCVLVTAVECQPPENPKNGKAIYTTCSYNSVVSYECKYGFTLVGESSRRCGADRKWSGAIPVCKEINCGHPGVLYNGWLENIESGTGLGATIIFRCHPGMLISGHTSTVCQIDGKWTYVVPQCLAPCVVPTISQGVVSPFNTDVDMNSTTTLMTAGVNPISKVKHGTILEVFCDEHYEFPISTLAPPTCNNGTWSVIPRCAPARCKVMPRPPKHGMVLAPKTEHGMKARFKCKDGFVLTGADGKNITDQNEYVLTCSFGNWTGITPSCIEVYCAFPGYIQNGKVLLVGNMGLYDYRPYVKKVVNNKQIMYECDKGYVFVDGVPPGATCVGGSWSPKELPICVPGQHPRLRWNRRRRRSIDGQWSRLRRFNPFINRYTMLQRQKRDLEPRFIPGYVKSDLTPITRFKKQQVVRNQLYHLNRIRRDITELEEAYSKYYDRIRSKYKNYVKNLLEQHRTYNVTPQHTFNQPSRPLQPIEHKVWYKEPYKSADQVVTPEHSITHLPTNDFLEVDDFVQYHSHYPDKHGSVQNAYPNLMKVMPIAIPNINEHHHNPETENQILDQAHFVNNEYNFGGQMDNNRKVIHSEVRSSAVEKRPNMSSIIAQLKEQIVRRKRSSQFDEFGEEKRGRRGRSKANYTMDFDDDGAEFTDNNGKKRPKTPCEPLQEEFARIETLRLGRDTTEPYGSGTLVKVTCHSGYTLNLMNPNGTAKCVRGRWKPMKPVCAMLPCTTPSTEHGHYFEIQVDPLNTKPETITLTTFSNVENGQIIALQCDPGYVVQGPNHLKCWNSEWTPANLPECVPAPCILPVIQNVKIQGGYRAGLAIAHGASISLQCDTSSSNSVQMHCNSGALSPKTIHCESNPQKIIRENYHETVDPSNLLNTDYSLNLVGRDCGHPERIQGSLIYQNEDEDFEDHGFPTGTEILFNCISSGVGERSTWKIVCEDGEWIGKSFNCANGSCIFRNNEPHVVSFYNDLEIREEIVEFPPGATLISRCVDIGKYVLAGSNERSCIHSEWSGQKPICAGLNQENDYAMEKAPTVLFRHQNGPIAQSNDGKLIVYPGTTVHMECLWMRRFGNPKWNVSHEFRKYPEGWVTEDGRDAQLEYRLSIITAVAEDSGIYTCMTPARHDHSVEVVVREIKCPEIPQRRGLAVSSSETKLSSRVTFSCANGNALIGSSELICMPSGNWSAPLPVCESVECGDINIPNQNGSSPSVAILSREVGGRAAFSCPLGFGLRGTAESVCLPSGEWATPFPTCIGIGPKKVTCDNPGAPQNGYAQGSPPYRAGDVVQFNCNPEYMMQGQPIIACQDNGRWSGGLPKCVQACSYPGTVISGRMSSVKFYYAIGESITFTCDAGLVLRGAKMLKCLRNGKWSNAIPTCVHFNDGNGNDDTNAKDHQGRM